MMTESPVREIRQIINDSGNPGYVNRLLIATPSRGTVRMEWVLARYGQLIPVNWSQVQMIEYMSSYVPLRYQVADAQNLIVKQVIDGDFEWLLLIEDDTIPPPDMFIRFNRYIREEQVPVVSGLYFTKSNPPEPLIFRGRGTSFYAKWKPGDLVWCDGVPTGCLLIHSGILREMWKDAEEYVLRGQTTRRVFDNPQRIWFDPETNQFNTETGTSDLEWCTKVIKGNYLAKAGWKDYQKKRWPFLVDTNILCRHISIDGQVFP